MAAHGGLQTVLETPSSLSDRNVSTIFAPLSNSQPFCGDPEGWGPLSPLRFDLTPCFLDIWVAVVAAWGVLGGAGALWLLLKRRTPQPVGKNWHFYTKLVGCLFLNTLFHFRIRWTDLRIGNNMHPHRHHGSPGVPSNRDVARCVLWRFPILDHNTCAGFSGYNLCGAIPRALEK